MIQQKDFRTHVIKISNKISKVSNNRTVYLHSSCSAMYMRAFASRGNRGSPRVPWRSYVRNDITNLAECKLTPVCFSMSQARQQLSRLSWYIPGQKNFLGKFPTEFIEEGARCCVFLSYIFRVQRVRVCATAQGKSASFPHRYWFRASVYVSFRLASSLFRQPCVSLTVSLCFSVFFNSFAASTLPLSFLRTVSIPLFTAPRFFPRGISAS